MLADLNSCTTRYLATIPGIDQGLAEAIVRYRRSHVRFSHFDELWRIDGISRSKYQLLRKHFSVTGEKRLVVGAKVPYARLTLSESMMNFVCKGQSMPPTSRPSSKSPPPTGPHTHRDSRHSGLRKNSAQPKVKFRPITASLQKLTDLCPQQPARKGKQTSFRRSNNPSSQVNCPSRGPTAVTLPVHHSELSPEDELVSCIANQNAINMVEDENTGLPSGGKHPSSDPSGSPAFIVQTSSTGNNINFSCTIDKRILRQPTSMAFQFDQAKPQPGCPQSHGRLLTATQTTAAGEVELQGVAEGEIKISELLTTKTGMLKSMSPKKDENNKHDKASHNNSAPSHSDYETVVQAPQQQFPFIHLYSNKSDTSSSQLSKENLLLYEKKNMLNKAERKQYVEGWINDVNDARHMRRFFKTDDQLGGYADGKQAKALRKSAKLPTPLGSKTNVTSGQPPVVVPNTTRTVHIESKPPPVPKAVAQEAPSPSRKVLSEEKEKNTTMTSHAAVEKKARSKIQTISYRHSLALAKSTPTVNDNNPNSKPPRQRPSSVETPTVQKQFERSRSERVKSEEVNTRSVEQMSEKRSCPGSATSEGHQSKKILMEAQKCLAQLKKQHGRAPRVVSTKGARTRVQSNSPQQKISAGRMSARLNKSEGRVTDRVRRPTVTSKQKSEEEFQNVTSSDAEPTKKMKPQPHHHKNCKAKKYIQLNTEGQTEEGVCNVM